MTDPIMKLSKVKTMEDLPPPKLYNVPEAQPFPICMPMPNINEPTMILTPIGETNPVGVAPEKLKPVPKIIANSVVATASMTMWACNPCTLPTETSLLKADVKPKRACNKVTPKAMPSKYKIACIEPEVTRIIANRITAAIEPIQTKGF